MATIAALTEDFESGSNGAALSGPRRYVCRY